MSPHHAPPGLDEFFSNLELFSDALWAGAAAGAMLGVLGVYVLLRNLVFVSAALSQAAGLGVALAFWARAALPGLLGGLDPALGAIAMTLMATVFFVRAHDHHDAHQDAQLGVGYLLGSAGTLAVATRIVSDLADIETLLFGSAVAVLPEDRDALLWTAGAMLLLHSVAWRGFVAISVDGDGARVRGLPVALLEAVLFFSLALGVSVATRVLGALPVFAFSVLPAMAAVKLARNVSEAIWIACGGGIAAATLGYLAAYRFELPVGAAQTLTCLLLLGIASVAELLLERNGHGHRH